MFSQTWAFHPQVPSGHGGKFLLTQMAAVAELEAGLTSQRTRAALLATMARGTVLGNPRLRADAPEQACARVADVLPYLDAARQAGAHTLHELAEALTIRSVPTPDGKGGWRPEQVKRVVASSP